MLKMEGYAMCMILITANDEGEKCTLNMEYARAIEYSGGLPFVLPLTADDHQLNRYMEKAEGLLLSGGGDVDPSAYGEERIPECGEASALRDKMEIALCKKAVEKGIPVLGICRGLQVMNIALGGTLHQHIENHARHDLPCDPAHNASILPSTRLYDILGKETVGVNTRHHQAIKDLGKGLTVTALAEDGIIEAVEMPGDRFFLAVQWHPEGLFSRYDDMKKIFAAFIAAVKGNT